jgi:hypothetical protein
MGVAKYIKNETTGKTLWLNYSLSLGEELTIDMQPGNRGSRAAFWRCLAGVGGTPGS